MELGIVHGSPTIEVKTSFLDYRASPSTWEQVVPMETLMHKHLVLTAICAVPPKSEKVIESFLNQLVDLVDMEIFMPAKAKYCDDPHNSGVTGVVVITTSHASIHIWDNVPGNPYPGMLQMDLYSCKDYQAKDVVDFVEAFFNANIVSYQVIDRGLPSSAISVAA